MSEDDRENQTALPARGDHFQWFWSARIVLGGVGLLCIAALIGSYPHPDYSFGVIAALLAAGLMPSWLTIAVLVRGGTWSRAVLPRIGWIALCWAFIALPITLVFAVNNNTFLVAAALPAQLLVLPLFVATRNPAHIALLQRMVRIGLVVMLALWLAASAGFAIFVRHAAEEIADGRPYCLTEPTPGRALRSNTVPSHLDFFLLQRIIAFPIRHEIARYRLQVNVPGADEAQWHLSFRTLSFQPGGDVGTTAECQSDLRIPASRDSSETN